MLDIPDCNFISAEDIRIESNHPSYDNKDFSNQRASKNEGLRIVCADMMDVFYGSSSEEDLHDLSDYLELKLGTEIKFEIAPGNRDEECWLRFGEVNEYLSFECWTYTDEMILIKELVKISDVKCYVENSYPTNLFDAVVIFTAPNIKEVFDRLNREQ